MTTQKQITNICLAVATATFMYFTYLYKRDVDIKLKMFSNYDITNTTDSATNTEEETLDAPFHIEIDDILENDNN
jgi:hypothetical protein